jgi:hypothetical protein
VRGRCGWAAGGVRKKPSSVPNFTASGRDLAQHSIELGDSCSIMTSIDSLKRDCVAFRSAHAPA